MSSDLIIEPLLADEWGYVAEACKAHGVELPARYCGDTGDYLLISLFNLASISCFINYVSELEGLQAQDAVTKTGFRNLPWWLESYWFPFDFAAPIVKSGLFIGSSINLLNELARIRTMSRIDIATVPPGYAEMRADYTSWFNAPAAEDDRLSGDDLLRWIWNALHESAQISIEQQAPIKLAP